MNRLNEKLSSGKSALLAGCLPPRDTDAASVKKLASYFPAVLDGVVVADNPSKVRGSALACAALLAAEKLEPMLSIITRDRNRVALEADVLGAAALGVKGFFCLTGAHQTLGASPAAAGAFDIDSTQLCEALSKMAGQGVDFDGNKLPTVPSFGIAAAVHPYLKPLDLSILQMKKKIGAGAQVLFTDPIFDVAGFETWMKAVRGAGLDQKVPIVASVLPLTSVAQAELLKARSGFAPIGEDVVSRLKSNPDPVAAGIEIVAEVAAKVKAVPGVRGIHILSDGCEHLVPKIIQEARLA